MRAVSLGRLIGVAAAMAHDEKAPRVHADEFRRLLSQSTALHEIAPPLATYLERFPSAELPGSEQFLYWGKGGVGPDASITLHQLIIHRAQGGETMIVDKQLYASRYVDAAIAVVSLAAAPDGKGFYALIGARARSTMLKGMAARLLRGRVEKATRDTMSMYLDWLRASLTVRPSTRVTDERPVTFLLLRGRREVLEHLR